MNRNDGALRAERMEASDANRGTMDGGFSECEEIALQDSEAGIQC